MLAVECWKRLELRRSHYEFLQLHLLLLLPQLGLLGGCHVPSLGLLGCCCQ